MPLIDMSVPQWLAMLNDRTEHDVLTVDTASLVVAHHDQIRLSAIAIAELAVIGGVPDIADHVVTVQRRHGLDVTAELPLTAAQQPVLTG